MNGTRDRMDVNVVAARGNGNDVEKVSPRLKAQAPEKQPPSDLRLYHDTIEAALMVGLAIGVMVGRGSDGKCVDGGPGT